MRSTEWRSIRRSQNRNPTDQALGLGNCAKFSSITSYWYSTQCNSFGSYSEAAQSEMNDHHGRPGGKALHSQNPSDHHFSGRLLPNTAVAMKSVVSTIYPALRLFAIVGRGVTVRLRTIRRERCCSWKRICYQTPCPQPSHPYVHHTKLSSACTDETSLQISSKKFERSNFQKT